MMDIQKMLDGISEMSRLTRSDYHLTLGALRKALAGLPADAVVVVDRGGGIGKEHSYRGYYADLSFEVVDQSTVAEVRAACKRAKRETYEGYKGGDFTYDDDTPLWLAPYGCTGAAIVGAEPFEGGLRLQTRDVR